MIVMGKTKDLADYITGRLLEEGFVVQRYDAYSTNSIYLKLDYGVCNSIRISDHQGKKHLKYKYNIGSYVDRFIEVKDRTTRIYYRSSRAENMIKRIVKDRDFKKSWYGESQYKRFMEKSRIENANAPGFWSEAVLLNKEG